jgi:hypothetical protein
MIVRCVLAVACAAGVLVAQDSKKSGSPCDQALIIDGKYCPKCKRVLKKTEKETDFDKEGKNCKHCGGPPESVKVCAKDWVPVCGMHEQRSHERACCSSKFCCKHDLVLSLVVFRCKTCGGETLDSARPACKGDCKGDYAPVCSRSGTAPHGADCDLKTVEQGPFCTDKQCRKVLDKTDMDKEGRCIACKKKPETVKICVKTDEGKTYKARVAITCRACKAEGAEGASCATKDCARNGKPLETVCTDSGCWPHGGVEPKRDK